MSTAITVRNLSKRYRIGVAEERSDSLIGHLTNMLKTPIQNLRALRGLSTFREDDESVYWALRNIDFDVMEGEVLGIIGHNGAGKSTLLKILSRITEPTSGEIEIKGRVSSLLEVGTGFHADLTGRENVYMNGTILGMKKREIDSKFEEIVEFSGIGKYINTPVKRYSSGMKVRLAFSVAAHLEPEVLIIDEVLAVGDSEFQSKCLGKMEDVAGQGRTVLFVSHNLAAVNSLCNRAIVLRNGVRVFEGNQVDAISAYRRFTFENVGFDFVRSNNDAPKIVSNLLVQEVGKAELNTVAVGATVEFLVSLHAGGNEFTDCSLSIGIFSNDDVLIVAFKSKVQYNKSWSVVGQKEIKIVWKNVNLIPGEYYLKCAFGAHGKIIDDISFAGRLRVIYSDDVYNSGNTIKQDQGYLVPFTQWEL